MLNAMKVPPFELPLGEIRRSLAPLRRPLSVAIIRAKNAFNVGAIIRVAHSFLVSNIVLVGNEPFYERAAMGMHRYENLVCLPDEESFVAWVKARELPIICFEREPAQVDLWRADLPGQCVMVFGSESDGIPPLILQAATSIVAIPMYGINNSYPVTVAAGIGIAEWTRRHYGGG